MNETKSGVWSVPQSPIVIHYSLLVIEEIRREVTQGFQKMARGGIEVGGVLYGKCEPEGVEILATRPIACEHALGPSFQLSEKDRAALNGQLEHFGQDPQLEDLVPVGFYLSHTRTEIYLTPTDLELFQTYFPHNWQIALVIRPGRAGAMRAGFFVRNAEGEVKTDHSYLEFNFPDRLAGILDRPRGERASGERERKLTPPVSGSQAADTPVLLASPPANERMLDARLAMADFSVPAPPKKSKWPWILAWAFVVAAVAGAGVRYFVLTTSAEPIGLSVLEKDGQLQITWNHAARPVVNAARGILDIADGSEQRPITLTTADLARGNFTYQRKTGDIEVRIIVEDLSGNKTEEASRFLGRPVDTKDKDIAPPAALENTKEAMQAENNRLRQENAAQARRIQQLERTLKIMTTRPGAPVLPGAVPSSAPPQ
jgi:hypothetical protein